MFHEFGGLRSPELKSLLAQNPLAVLPVGQIEEHGPHLPVDTDCVIASACARAAAERLGERAPVLLMEPIKYGYSGQTMTRWPGTMQVGMDTVRDYVYDVCASLADMGVRKIVIVDGHGHHAALLELVARRLADEKQVAPAILSPAGLAAEALKRSARGGPEGTCHAGEFETSLMLFLRPDSVDMAAAADEPLLQERRPPSGVFWSTWERQPTKSGIYGKPTLATAENGRAFFKAMVANAAEFMEKYYRAT